MISNENMVDVNNTDGELSGPGQSIHDEIDLQKALDEYDGIGSNTTKHHSGYKQLKDFPGGHKTSHFVTQSNTFEKRMLNKINSSGAVSTFRSSKEYKMNKSNRYR